MLHRWSGSHFAHLADGDPRGLRRDLGGSLLARPPLTSWQNLGSAARQPAGNLTGQKMALALRAVMQALSPA